jgi:ABC-type dipeptide/oligopeptide/nickel transport system permease subunit
MKPASELARDPLFGSGKLGRTSGRVSCTAPDPHHCFLATLLALVLGTIVGPLAAYSRGVLDEI